MTAARQEAEDRHLRELALRAAHGDVPRYTRFLEAPEEAQCRAAAREAEAEVAFWGGYAEAERRIAAFCRGEAPAAEEFPLVCLELRWNAKYASPGHRDLLGATLGLGLARDAVGDIARGRDEGCAFLFVHRDVAAYVRDNLDSAGRARLRVCACEGEPELRPPEGVSLRVTVAGERLDAVLSAGLRLSRAEARRLVETGLVRRNHAEEVRPDVALRAGDLLSVRGYGRLRVEGFEGFTRRGRLAVRLFRYTG